MNSILVPVMALAISMVVIPIMLRLAPALGLVDRASARKRAGVRRRGSGFGILVLGRWGASAINGVRLDRAGKEDQRCLTPLIHVDRDGARARPAGSRAARTPDGRVARTRR
jgi:hypothetical protein